MLRTVRAKLILTTTVVIAVVLAILGIIVDVAARSTMLGVIDRDLQTRAEDLARGFEQGMGPRGMGPGGPPPGGGFRGGMGGGVRMRGPGSRDGRMSAPVVIRMNPGPEEGGPPPPSPIDEFAYRTALRSGPLFTTRRIEGETRRIYTTVSRRDGAVENVIQLSYPLDEVLEALARLRNVLLTVMLPVGMLLAAVASLMVVGRLLAPLKRMTGEAERIGGGTLSERLRVMGEDEFAALATTLNGMLGRIEQNFEQQRRFTADASHELKTPLAVIKANIGIVRHGKPTADEAKESAEAIDAAADRMSALVSDLLVLARADAGRSSTTPVVCDLRDILHGAIRSVPRSERVAFAGGDAPVSVLASPEDLTRALVNLIDNALNYSAPGSQVIVELESTGSEAAICVKDRGPGIDPKHLEHIFERFYRPDQSRTASSGGTGLGLAIAKGIVENHGGSIAIQSHVGQGTTVEVRLPKT